MPGSAPLRESYTVIRERLDAALRDALTGLGVEPPASISLERPARREHGDWSSNVALVTAKAADRQPRELAAALAASIMTAAPLHVAAVEVAGPGFVNFRLQDSWLHEVLAEVVEGGEERYARPDLGKGKRVNVEFVSANPTGPLHAGGGRWAAYGDSLCNLLSRCGHEVHREYYLNDRGVQMELFGASLAARKSGEPLPEDGYVGEYVAEWAAEMPDDVDPAEWGYERVKQDLAASLERIGVRFDTWFSERSMVGSGAIAETLTDLRDRGVIYEADGAVWLRTTDFGDDKDRVVVKSDGEPTYVLPDIAYHRDKFSRGWQLLIDVWGADHHGYQARLKVGVQALGHSPDELEIILGQLVTLVRGASRCACRSGPATSCCSTTSSTRWGPTSPASRSCSSRWTHARPSTSTSSPRSRWRTRSSTCSTPTPASTHRAQSGRDGAERGRSPRSTSACSPTSVSSSCCALSPSCPMCS